MVLLAFTTREFPNKVFENQKEYNTYLELRKKIVEQLRKKTHSNKIRVVKVKSALRKKDPLVQLLLLWISQLQKT